MTRRRWFIVAFGVLQLLALAAVLGVVDTVLARRMQRASEHQLRVFEPQRDPAAAAVLAVKPYFRQLWKRPEFSVEVRTNGHGFREDFDFELASLDLAFFGDSFVFGHGVEAGQRVSDLVRRAVPGPTVASLAYPNGFAPPHYWAYAVREPSLAPRVAVVGLFLGNDLHADVLETRIEPATPGLRGLRVELPLRAWTAEGVQIHQSEALRPAARWLRACCALGRWTVAQLNQSEARGWLFAAGDRHRAPNAANPPALRRGTLHEPARESLGRLRDLAAIVEARGGKTLVLVIPERDMLATDPDGQGLLHAVIDWCEREPAIECVDPSPALASAGPGAWFERDRHWTPLGHRVAAETLLPVIRARLSAAPAPRAGS